MQLFILGKVLKRHPSHRAINVTQNTKLVCWDLSFFHAPHIIHWQASPYVYFSFPRSWAAVFKVEKTAFLCLHFFSEGGKLWEKYFTSLKRTLSLNVRQTEFCVWIFIGLQQDPWIQDFICIFETYSPPLQLHLICQKIRKSSGMSGLLKLFLEDYMFVSFEMRAFGGHVSSTIPILRFWQLFLAN